MDNLNKALLKQYQDAYDKESYLGPDKVIEEKIKPKLKSKFLRGEFFLTKAEFEQICFWKAKRNKRNYSSNSESYIKYVTNKSFTSNNDRFKIEALTLLAGVQYPTASTILHFAFPEKYPIIDWRVLWSLGRLGFPEMVQPTKYVFDFYNQYMKIIHSLSKKYNLSLRAVDKALWKYADNKEGAK